MLCRDATTSSFDTKFWGEIFVLFQAVSVKSHSSMRSWLLDLPGQILYEQSLWCRRKLWASSWLCSSPVLHFSVPLSSDFRVRLMLSSANTCLIIARVSMALFPRFVKKSYVVSLSDPSRNQINQIQIKWRKYEHMHTVARNVVHCLQRQASTIIYRCIALLQLLYR
jgi:hypothetical protein